MAKPKYSSVEEMQRRIDSYFENCAGTILAGKDGKPVLDRTGQPVMVNKHPPTMTGLAMALGFRTRKSLCDYRRKGEFQYTVMRARLRVENYAEERLYDRDGVNGAMFSLCQNFGWNTKNREKPKERCRTAYVIDNNAGAS